MISSSLKPYDKNNIILMYKLSHFNLMQEFCFCSPVGDYLALVDIPLSFLLATKSFYKDLYLFYSVLQMFPNSIYHILKPMVYQIPMRLVRVGNRASLLIFLKHLCYLTTEVYILYCFLLTFIFRKCHCT